MQKLLQKCAQAHAGPPSRPPLLFHYHFIFQFSRRKSNLADSVSNQTKRLIFLRLVCRHMSNRNHRMVQLSTNIKFTFYLPPFAYRIWTLFTMRMNIKIDKIRSDSNHVTAHSSCFFLSFSSSKRTPAINSTVTHKTRIPCTLLQQNNMCWRWRTFVVR